MKTGIELTVIWEEVVSPDAQQRLATAFAMLFSPTTAPDLMDRDLDSEK
jgi:hypothetical protein